MSLACRFRRFAATSEQTPREQQSKTRGVPVQIDRRFFGRSSNERTNEESAARRPSKRPITQCDD